MSNNINAVVNPPQATNVRVNLTGTVINQAPVTLKNTPSIVSGQLTLENLTNIDSTHEDNGYTLIYDSVTGKWVSQPLAIDGGNF